MNNMDQKQRNIPVCITFPPDLLDFFDQLAEHEKIKRNTLIISLLDRLRNGIVDQNNEKG